MLPRFEVKAGLNGGGVAFQRLQFLLVESIPYFQSAVPTPDSYQLSLRMKRETVYWSITTATLQDAHERPVGSSPDSNSCVPRDGDQVFAVSTCSTEPYATGMTLHDR